MPSGESPKSWRARYSDVVLNLSVAVAISLVINFSYLLFLLVDPSADSTSFHRTVRERGWQRSGEGRLSVHPDGYGYLVYPDGDSVYVLSQSIRRFGLASGDLLQAEVRPPSRNGGHAVLHWPRMRNGETVSLPGVFYDRRPSQWTELSLQTLFFVLQSFVLVTLLTTSCRRYSTRRYIRSLLLGGAVAGLFYFVIPVTERHTGRVLLNFMSGRMFDYHLLLKASFALVVALLYSRLYVLISQRQLIEVENERLKNENLTTRYNLLVGQINPHFFFNSLNSLAMLVREGHDRKALTYIDQLSYTFRYILRNGQSPLITLGEEMKFAEAYSYLFKIRYADKLYFDLDVAPSSLDLLLPALSLQPLIDNAVKHNTITRSNPLRISIRTAGSHLVVSNPLRPKLAPEPSTGIGLENLRNRWQLITGRSIEIDDSGGRFTVRLPLIPPAAR